MVERRPAPTPAPSTTTLEEDRLTLGERRINLIWEITQALIAITIVLANVVAAFREVIPTQSVLLANAFFLVIGFYFGRTNHARMGSRKAPALE